MYTSVTRLNVRIDLMSFEDPQRSRADNRRRNQWNFLLNLVNISTDSAFEWAAEERRELGPFFILYFISYQSFTTQTSFHTHDSNEHPSWGEKYVLNISSYFVNVNKVSRKCHGKVERKKKKLFFFSIFLMWKWNGADTCRYLDIWLLPSSKKYFLYASRQKFGKFFVKTRKIFFLNAIGKKVLTWLIRRA